VGHARGISRSRVVFDQVEVRDTPKSRKHDHVRYRLWCHASIRRAECTHVARMRRFRARPALLMRAARSRDRYTRLVCCTAKKREIATRMHLNYTRWNWQREARVTESCFAVVDIRFLIWYINSLSLYYMHT